MFNFRYIPCIMLVIVSQVSFWIDENGNMQQNVIKRLLLKNNFV
jgi:hypothetical protein